MAFKPNSLTFEQGAQRVAKALQGARLDINKQIVTSRDAAVVEVLKALEVTNVPAGFTKWQLPIVLNRGQLFISLGAPNTDVPEHSHDEGAGVRFVVSGSVNFGNHELTAGDWMYIPKGLKYSLKVGPLGAVMCYCYECCCA